MKRKLISLVLAMTLCLSSLTVSAASSADCLVDGHSWGSWKTSTKATCTVNGLKMRTCRVCKEAEEVVIEKTGHKYKSSWKKITKKSLPCADESILKNGKYTTCTKCKDIKVKDENGKEISKDSKAFNHVSKTITKTLRKSNCAGGAVKVTCCQKCKNITKTEVGNKKNHKYGKLSLGKKATCTADGYYYKACKGCGHQEKYEVGSDDLTSKQLDLITALGHNPGGFAMTADKTCTTNAQYEQRCTSCRVLLATGEGGQEKTWTNRNGHEYTITLDGKSEGHKWINVFNDDKTPNGQMCTRCGAKQ